MEKSKASQVRIHQSFHFRLDNNLNILFYLQVIPLHHRIVQHADSLNILISVLYFLQSFVVVQYLAMKSFQFNFTVRIVGYHPTNSLELNPDILEGDTADSNCLERLIEVSELFKIFGLLLVAIDCYLGFFFSSFSLSFLIGTAGNLMSIPLVSGYPVNFHFF